MAYRYSRRTTRKLARKSKHKFIISLIITGAIFYATFIWILPNFIGGVGFVKNTINPPEKNAGPEKKIAIAPPVLNIPYEATNSAQIDIRGFGTPNSEVKLFIDDDLKQTADVASDGKFIFTNVSLVLGTNNIYGKTTEEEKESLPSKTIKIAYDNEKPSLNLNGPPDGTKIQGGDKKVKVAGTTEPGIKVFINDSQTVVDRDGNFNSEVLLNDGDNLITVKAIDTAGNTTEEQRIVNYSS